MDCNRSLPKFELTSQSRKFDHHVPKYMKAITTGHGFPCPGTNAWGGILYRQG